MSEVTSLAEEREHSLLKERRSSLVSVVVVVTEMEGKRRPHNQKEEAAKHTAVWFLPAHKSTFRPWIAFLRWVSQLIGDVALIYFGNILVYRNLLETMKYRKILESDPFHLE